jgi:hypothetical protein
MEVVFFFGAERSLKAERNCFNLIVNEREFELSKIVLEIFGIAEPEIFLREI